MGGALPRISFRPRSIQRFERTCPAGRFVDASSWALSLPPPSLSLSLSLSARLPFTRATHRFPYRSCCCDSIAEHTWTRFVF